MLMPEMTADLSFAAIALITLTFFLAGIVKGATGMGLPTVAMGVLGLFMSPVTAASLLILPSFVTNIWQLLAGPSFIALLKRLWTMMLAIIIGTLLGASFMAGNSGVWATAALGVALASYAAYTLLAPPFSVPDKIEPWLSPIIGLLTGLMTGATGVFVIPAVPYIQALGFDRENLVQALGLSFTVSTIALAIGLGSHSAFQLQELATSTLAVAPALLGMWAGQIVRRAVSPATFKRWFLICLLLLGLQLALRPLMG
jgi:uncharacterized membrane protein YfcA